ncbi:hypothetical protein [Candidatus Rhabdochlamydia sp. T3358]|uniref:hypothetical protein n=1 Tax=Candidatus Rhabdochlamydia sp. T3358 TaxID=2099795 RepID=UPI0010B892F5|nr:hypothetical protein [Candidatus Rhabdochlamydia sp. T3358]VHO03194.1 hypothetical protein RHT_00810 [Candidatus Rhabdochlamydia sp. T3358]
MAASTDLSFLNRTFTTPFNKQNTPVKDYLIGQTAFSTAFGFFVCHLPFFQSAALGLATEGCRYVTDKAVEQLSAKFSLIRDNKTAVKTALVAGSFFLAKAVVNTILPGSSSCLRAGLLMSATYLVAEPLSRRVYEACTTDKTIKACFNDIKDDIYAQYPAATKKIADLWNRFFGSNGNRLGGDGT